MALDVVTLNQNVTVGKDIGVDNIGGVDFEVIKMAFGVEGVVTLVSTLNPLPVAIYTNTSLQFIDATAGQTDFVFVGVPDDFANYIFWRNEAPLRPKEDAGDPPLGYFKRDGDTLTTSPVDVDDVMRFQRIQ